VVNCAICGITAKKPTYVPIKYKLPCQKETVPICAQCSKFAKEVKFEFLGFSTYILPIEYADGWNPKSIAVRCYGCLIRKITPEGCLECKYFKRIFLINKKLTNKKEVKK